MTDGLTIDAEGGTITVTPAALSTVVVQAAESVDGVRVRRRRGVDVEVADGEARVELDLAARYGVVLPEAAREAQENVAGALARMCGLEASAVDVTFEELDS